MTGAVRQYGRWLRDNYADLEHKELRASHTLLLVVLLLFVNYGFADDDPSFLLIRLTDFVLFALLLWRVETLPQLEEVAEQERGLTPAPSTGSLTPDPSPKERGVDGISAESPSAESNYSPLPGRGAGGEALGEKRHSP